MSDPILAMLLAELGCPYGEGTPDATAWLAGFKAGFEDAAKLAVEARAASPDWQSRADRATAN